MPLAGPYTPPGARTIIAWDGVDGIQEFGGGGPAVWDIDGVLEVSVTASGIRTIYGTFTSWGVTYVSDGKSPVIINVRVVGQIAFFGSDLTAQLYLGGALIGNPITISLVVLGPAFFDRTFMGTVNFEGAPPALDDWGVDLTEADVEDPGFGVRLTWENPTFLQMDGVSVSVQFEQIPSTIQLSRPSYSVDEDAGTVTVYVQRADGDYGAADIDYATSNGSAIAGVDYTATNGTLSWADGDSGNKTFNVPITNRAGYQGNRTFRVTLSTPVGWITLGTPSTATVTIVETTPVPSAEELLNDTLTGYAPLTALVGAGVYRLRFPPGVSFPLCVFQRVTSHRDHALSGEALEKAALFQIVCYADDPVGATTVAEAVEAACVSGIAAAGFADVTMGNEMAQYHPDADLYSQLVEVECLQPAPVA